MDNALDVAGLRNVFIFLFGIELLTFLFIYLVVRHNIEKISMKDYRYRQLRIIGNMSIVTVASCLCGMILIGFGTVACEFSIGFLSILGSLTQFVFVFLIPMLHLWFQLKE